ncbi:hypothetical protein GCM10011349_41930 [Novosphingobium indicum]|uniref:VWFA domain-containing protein n=1 Tax=Novosphingobium indicum TaxID=462949 RepID=A0ABQ2K2K2_9SPHN|nr:TerY-C metal binding domain-containing protein [Novosphingobium indicum]GGN60407.1 hypothetical protein GCM10011349_41930 [Novosphingobium indicum]
MRRLPIYFLVDVSESMAGQNLHMLQDGIGETIRRLRTDPYALETAFVSVVVFAGKAKTIMPLTELPSFHTPELPVGGGTSLGLALDHIMTEMDRNLVKTTAERKGDWQPFIFLLTDGHPTDNTSAAELRWNQDFRSRVNLVAVSVGGGADHAMLKRLTDDVMVFDDKAPEAFTHLIDWITRSIGSLVSSVQAGQDRGVNLAKGREGLLERIERPHVISPDTGIDDRFAVFIGKCSKSKLPYLVKYERHFGEIETSDTELSRLFRTKRYALSGAVQVKNSYFELSDEKSTEQSVTSDELAGQPNCPHCNAPFGMAICACGKIHCVEGEGPQTCPWCGNTGMYGSTSAGDELKIGRQRG